MERGDIMAVRATLPSNVSAQDFMRVVEAQTANEKALGEAYRIKQAAAQTGLTPEEFVQGGLLDYNSSFELAKKEMEQYEELMLQCLKNMRRQQYNGGY